ncbi:MAG: PilW family protein [Candidatus Xenobia bacterium]
MRQVPGSGRPCGLSHRHCGGATLVETLVAMAVTALLVTSVCQVVIVLGRVSTHALSRADLQAGGLVGLNRLVREVRGASTLNLAVAGQSLSFSGIVYYVDGEHRLIRKTVPNSQRLSPAELNNATSQHNGTEVCIASNVAALKVTPDPFPAPTPADTLQLELDMQQQTEALTLHTAVMLRNGP